MNFNGETCLHWTLKNKPSNKDILRLFLNFNCNLKLQDSDGNTPLHLASRVVNRSPGLDLRLLMSIYLHGSDDILKMKNENGFIPYQETLRGNGNASGIRFFWDLHMYTQYPRYLPIITGATNIALLIFSIEYFGWFYGAILYLLLIVGAIEQLKQRSEEHTSELQSLGRA